MTEAEWDAARTLHERFVMLQGRSGAPVPRRKLGLFVCACCQYLLDPPLPDVSTSELVAATELAERLADSGLGTQQARDLWPHRSRARQQPLVLDFLTESVVDRRGRIWDAAGHIAAHAVSRRVRERLGPVDPDRSMATEWRAAKAIEREHLGRLLSDIFGNPFRPFAFDPRWRTADTLGLARGIYEDRAFGRLPLLADALMDAGCADEQVLSHCRSDGPHVRGCWVVDLVLGKE